MLILYEIKKNYLWHHIAHPLIQIFHGNHDSSTPMKVVFAQGVEAKYIRLYPKTWINNIAAKLIIYGCKRPEAVVIQTTTAAPRHIEEEDTSTADVSSYSIKTTFTSKLGKKLVEEMNEFSRLIGGGGVDNGVVNQFNTDFGQLMLYFKQLQHHSPDSELSEKEIVEKATQQMTKVKSIIDANGQNGKISPVALANINTQFSKVNNLISHMSGYLNYTTTSTSTTSTSNVTTISETSVINTIGGDINQDTEDFGKLITAEIVSGDIDKDVALNFQSEYNRLIELSNQLQNFKPGAGFSIQSIYNLLKDQAKTVRDLIKEEEDSGKINTQTADTLIAQTTKIDDKISNLVVQPGTTTVIGGGGGGSYGVHTTIVTETSDINTVGGNINTETQTLGNLINAGISSGNIDYDFASSFKIEFDRLKELSQQLQNYVPGGGIDISSIYSLLQKQTAKLKDIIKDGQSSGKINSQVAESLVEKQAKIEDNVLSLVVQTGEKTTGGSSSSGGFRQETITAETQDSSVTTTTTTDIGENLRKDTNEFGRLISLGLLEGNLDEDVAQLFKTEFDKLMVFSKQLENYATGGSGLSLHQIYNDVSEQVSYIKNIIVENIAEGKIRGGLKFTLIDQEDKLDNMATVLENHAVTHEGDVSHGETFTSVTKDIVTINNMLSEVKEATIADTSKKDNLVDMMSNLEKTMKDLEEYKREINEKGRLTELSLSSIKAEIEKMKKMKLDLESQEFKNGLNKETITTINKIDVKSETVINSLISYVNKKKVEGNELL